MTTLETDVAVIGAGTAGVTAFHAIRRAGPEALLIDRGPLGTTCARVGCMPSKAALHAAQQWRTLLRLTGGIVPAGCSANALWHEARQTRDALWQAAAQRTRSGAGERLLEGEARFLAPDLLAVGAQRVRARAFVVAPGSHPVVPPPLAALGERVLTTDSLFELERLPRSLGLVGLGAIGLEMGLARSRLGVQVVAADLQRTVAGIADPAVRERALERFGRELPLWLGHPASAEATAQGVRLASGDRSATVDALLVAVGRRPNVEGLDLAQAGVALDAQGQARIDPATLRAGAAPVFLAGDVHPQRPLMHEAADEGVIAARGALALLAGEPAPRPARRTPLSIVFADPDVVAVGASLDALDRDAIVIGQAEGRGNGRSKILHAPENLVRLYVARAGDELLGASAIATQGEHLGHLLAWAVQRRETVDGLLALPYYHPSIEEMVQSALEDAAGQLANLSSRISA